MGLRVRVRAMEKMGEGVDRDWDFAENPTIPTQSGWSRKASLPGKRWSAKIQMGPKVSEAAATF